MTSSGFNAILAGLGVLAYPSRPVTGISKLDCILKTTLAKPYILILSASLIAPAAFAQSGGPFSLSWSTVAVSAGAGSGGSFALIGTLGQPDAGDSYGGLFSLTAGFWNTTIMPPVLGISISGGILAVAWPLPATGFVLEQSAVVGPGASWSQVDFPHQTNATRVFISVPAPAENKFYRLRKP